METDFFVFNVGLGQSVFVYPRGHHEYGMLIDVGHDGDIGFHPIDFLQNRRFVGQTLGNITLTNYDQDHFSGLPYLRQRVHISTIDFPRNLSTADLRSMKQRPHTDALNETCAIYDTYTTPVPLYQPPFTKHTFSLRKEDLDTPDTNNLSQIVFIEHNGSVICIGGDLEEKGWKILLKRQEVRDSLARTNVLVASHHGRENGYCPDLFTHCRPDCVIISDKNIVHDTQVGLASKYGGHVPTGIALNGERRKVLTTRNDGHIWVRFAPGGQRFYATFNTN